MDVCVFLCNFFFFFLIFLKVKKRDKPSSSSSHLFKVAPDGSIMC